MCLFPIPVSLSSLSDCEPVRYPGELQGSSQFAPSGDNVSTLYAPCGLIAWSMFNGTALRPNSWIGDLFGADALRLYFELTLKLWKIAFPIYF